MSQGNVTRRARSVALRQAEQITVVRRRAQPKAVYIARLTVTAVFAYVIAMQLPNSGRPILAPLTALLVVQASLFQTIRSAFRRVVSVIAGVLAAIVLSSFASFAWWELGLLIGGALVIGNLLRLGDEILEVPISAMLIFAIGAGLHGTAAGNRIADTLIGAAAGLVASVIYAPLRVQPARQAVADLSGQLAGQLDEMADGLRTLPDSQTAVGWMDRARTLRGEIERVEDALREAEDSVRLNPRATEADIPVRDGLESLQHIALTSRVLTRSVIESSRLESPASPTRAKLTRARLAAVLRQLATAMRTYGALLSAPRSRDPELESELRQQLAEAHRLQDSLAAMLRPDGDSREWPLRGEILSHVDRLRTELQDVPPPRNPRPRYRRRVVPAQDDRRRRPRARRARDMSRRLRRSLQ